jgi:hypothetical protein
LQSLNTAIILYVGVGISRMRSAKIQIKNERKELINKVLNWTINNMQSKKGYFYFQKKKGITSKIAYMRWAQAWMFYAFSIYFIHEQKQKN